MVVGAAWQGRGGGAPPALGARGGAGREGRAGSGEGGAGRGGATAGRGGAEGRRRSGTKSPWGGGRRREAQRASVGEESATGWRRRSGRRPP